MTALTSEEASQSAENSLDFQKGHLAYLRKWLDTPVNKAQNRHRNEIIKIIQPSCDEIEEQRIDILKQYAILTPEGQIDTASGGVVRFPTDDASKAAQVAYEALLQEPIKVLFTKPKALDFLREFLQNLNVSFSYIDGQAYDEICSILGMETEE